MNKRITSLLLCFIMVFAMLTTAVPALAAGTVKFTMTSNKTEASPGDTITYTVTMGEVSRFDSLKFKLSIPTGLTFVANSGKLADGLKDTLNCVDTAWTESTKVFYVTMCSEGVGYTSTTPTKLMEFQCKVDDSASGSLKIEFIIEANNCYDSDYDNIAFSTETPSINITAAPKPATSITLNKSTTTIYTGGSETLIATVSPTDTTDTVTWESNTTSVATVDSTGKVSAIAPGTAVITAKAGSKSVTCTVTVENAPCTHANTSNVSAKSSTCQNRGWDAYKKCDTCGQLFNTAGSPISEIPYRSLADHTGGTATCLERATCTECGQFYGNYASHDYTKQEKSALAKKSSGTCKDEAVYWYSCNVCGVVERNDSHTFKGEKDPNNHIASTYKLNQKEANCKEEGYTGDTHCADCDQKLLDGTIIGKSEHNPSTLWSGDNTKHWKECTNVIGCGVKLQEGNHTSTGENEATCEHRAVCDTCLKQYGDYADHDWAPATCTAPKTCRTCGATEGAALPHTEGTEWKHDSTNHWHICIVAGCGTVIESSKAAHRPDHEGGASTEYEVKCLDCEYVIYAKLNKAVPRFNMSGYEIGKKITQIRVSLDSTSVGVLDIPYYGEDFAIYPQDPSASEEGLHSVIIDDNAVFESDKDYYLVVVVRANSTSAIAGLTKDDILLNGSQKPIGFIETTSGNVLPVFKLNAIHAHTEGTEWKSDANNHWHICAVAGCGVVIDSSKAAHTFDWKIDKAATATEKGSKHEECTLCGYKKAAVEIPATGTATEPTTPTEPTNPENTAKPENSSSPKTGNNTALGLWLALVFISGFGVAGTTLYSKKKKAK